MATIVTEKALEGFVAGEGAKCPYLATSVSSDAWAIGEWLRKNGKPVPDQVRKSRGDSYWVDGVLVVVKWKNNIAALERISK